MISGNVSGKNRGLAKKNLQNDQGTSQQLSLLTNSDISAWKFDPFEDRYK
jgi:hypothetical protein